MMVMGEAQGIGGVQGTGVVEGTGRGLGTDEAEGTCWPLAMKIELWLTGEALETDEARVTEEFLGIGVVLGTGGGQVRDNPLKTAGLWGTGVARVRKGVQKLPAGEKMGLGAVKDWTERALCDLERGCGVTVWWGGTARELMPAAVGSQAAAAV